jgi:hypothetical protein
LDEVPDSTHFNKVFDHEMMHAVGFMGHYNKVGCPLMTDQICGKKMTQNEEKLIWMLYSSGIPIDIGENQIREFFKTVNI